MKPTTNNQQPTTKMKNSLKLGWIGIRASKVGKASAMLKGAGWIKLCPADVNNRDACNWVRPVRTEAEYLTSDWTPLANAGLEGVAFWVSDLQWGKSAAATTAQWSRRSVIEFVFNSAYPTGRRAAA